MRYRERRVNEALLKPVATPYLERNIRIMLYLLVRLTFVTREYLKCEHIVFPKNVLKAVKLGMVYVDKVIMRFDLNEIQKSDKQAVINRLENQMLKSPHRGNIEIPDEDFHYLINIDVGIMLLDEILENQKNIPKACKTYLKTGRTYYKKFLSFVAEELEA